MVPSSVIYTALLCRVTHCFPDTAMSWGPRGKMSKSRSSPGPSRQTVGWERVHRSSAYSSTVVWFALPCSIKQWGCVFAFKALKTLRKPPETLTVVWLWECWNHCWSLWWWHKIVWQLPGRGTSSVRPQCNTSHANHKICAAALIIYCLSMQHSRVPRMDRALPGCSYHSLSRCASQTPNLNSAICRAQLWTKGQTSPLSTTCNYNSYCSVSRTQLQNYHKDNRPSPKHINTFWLQSLQRTLSKV